MGSAPVASPAQAKKYAAITPVETILLVLGLCVGFFVYRLGVAYVGGLFPRHLDNIGWGLLYLIAALGVPSFMAPLAGMAFPSWRYKTICGVVLLFALVVYGVIGFFESLPEGFGGLLGWVIRFAVRLSAALGGFRIWRAWQEARALKHKAAAPIDVTPSEKMPRAPLALIVLSLLSIPAAYVSIVLSMFVTIGLSALLFAVLSEAGRVPVVLIAAAALAPFVGAWASIKALRIALSPPVFAQPAQILKLTGHPALRRFVSGVCSAVGTRLPDNVVLNADPTFYVTQGRLMTLDGPVKGRTLALGMPLLRTLSPTELASVIAHEFAHFSGRDTLYSSLVSPVQRGLQTSVQVLCSPRGNSSIAAMMAILQLPSLHFLVASAQLLGSMTMLVSRWRELRADWIAAECFGREAFCSALRKSVGVSCDFPESMKTLSWNDARALFSSYEAHLEREPEKLSEYSRKALEEEQETEYSSHPSLRTRESSLPGFTPSVRVPPGDLLAELSADEARLSEAFAPMVTDYQQRWIAATATTSAAVEASPEA